MANYKDEDDKLLEGVSEISLPDDLDLDGITLEEGEKQSDHSLFQEDDENEEEKEMGNFDDANVDKDLLSQIFADDGEDLDDLLDETSEDKIEEAAEVPAIEEETKETEEKAEEEAVPEEKIEEPVSFTAEMESGDNKVRQAAEEEMNKEREEGTVTVITKGTTIRGGISSDGSLEVMGIITGDIECLGKVAIHGTVTGSVIASDIFVNTPRLEGGLSSEGTVQVGVGTVVIGDVIGSSAYIAGAVKGDIDVNGPIVIDSTAIVKGNIKAKSIQINTGAVVDGYCTLNYAGVDLDSFFDEK